MTLVKNVEGAPAKRALEKQHPSATRVSAASATLDLEAPAHEEWAALARQHVRTAERQRVVDVLSRLHGKRATNKALVSRAGVNIDTVRATLRELRDARLLGCVRATASRRGYVGRRWLLCDGERCLPPRDEQSDCAPPTPASSASHPGMNRAVPEPPTPAPCLLSPSDTELIYAKDEAEKRTDEQAAYDYVERRVAWLERQFGKKIHRGKHRELVFAALLESEDGVRACYEQACERGMNPLGLFLLMIEDGDHRVLASSAHPRCTRCEEPKTVHDRAEDIARAGYGHPGVYLVCDACASSAFGLAPHRDQEGTA